MTGRLPFSAARTMRQMRMVIQVGRQAAKPFDKAPVAGHSRRMDIRIHCLCIDTR